MLYIVRKTRDEELTWHVGEKKPEWPVYLSYPSARGNETEPFKDVVEIQADGHELEYIRQNFKNLPDATHKRVVSWKGDMAQFIYDHLT